MNFLNIPKLKEGIRSRTSSIGSRNSGNSTPTIPTTPISPSMTTGPQIDSEKTTIDYAIDHESGVGEKQIPSSWAGVAILIIQSTHI